MSEETGESGISGQRTSDSALKSRTGKAWAEWYGLLDDWGAMDRKHPEIAEWLVTEHGVAGWWAQAITVGYEQERGLRAPGQVADGTFAASGSKTVNVPVERLFQAFADQQLRARWLPEAAIHVRTATAPKSLRADWVDGSSRIYAFFTPKGDAKAQVSLQYEKLPGVAQAQNLVRARSQSAHCCTRRISYSRRNSAAAASGVPLN